MASKKKTQPKRKVISAPKTPKVKMLDFTKDRTTPVAKNYEKGISKLLINYLKNSNIPVLVELSKDQEILPHYFLDQTFYARMLGDNIIHLNNAVKAAIVDTLMEGVAEAMRNKKAVYPGIWPRGAIYAIVATRVNIRRPSDNPKAGWYLTVRPYAGSNSEPVELTTEEMSKLPAVECMAFGDYNSNRLFQFCMEAINQAITLIMNQIANGVPNAYIHTASESLAGRYAREFGTILNENLKKTKWRETEHRGTVTDLFSSFVSIVESPLVGHMSALLSLSGLSTDVINRAFSNSNATAYYSVSASDREDDTIYDLSDVIGSLSMTYALTNKDPQSPMQIVFTAAAADLMHAADVINGDSPMPDALNRVGNALVRFYDYLVKYAMAIYVTHADDPMPVPGEKQTNDTVTPEDYEGE